MRHIGLLVGAAAVAAGCGGSLSGASGGASASLLSAYGMSVQLPAGWSARIVLGVSGRPVLHAASYPLIGGNDNDSGEIARESLGTANAIYLNVRDLGSGDSSTPFPLAFAASDFVPSPPAEGIQMDATRDVSIAGRPYRVSLASGGADPPAAPLLEEANRVLRGLSLEPYVPVPVPRLLADAESVEGYGISMRLPSGWGGHVGRGELDAASGELRLRLLEHVPAQSRRRRSQPRTNGIRERAASPTHSLTDRRRGPGPRRSRTRTSRSSSSRTRRSRLSRRTAS